MLSLLKEKITSNYMIVFYYMLFLALVFPMHKAFGLPLIAYIFAFALLALLFGKSKSGDLNTEKLKTTKGMSKLEKALCVPLVKNILLTIGFVFVTYCFFASYKHVREIFEVEPEFLGFTTSFLFLWNVFNKTITILFFIIIASAIAFAVSNKGFSAKAKTPKVSGELKLSMYLVIFLYLTSLGIHMVTNPVTALHKFFDARLPNTELAYEDHNSFDSLIQKFAVYIDFMPYHHCNNPEVINRTPVLFLDKGMVLILSDSTIDEESLGNSRLYSSNFEVHKCYIEDESMY